MKMQYYMIGILAVLWLGIFTESLYAQWQTSGSNIYYNNGNVGIGTNNPANLFVVAKDSNAMSINWGSLGFNRSVTDGAIYNLKGSAWQFTARNEMFTLEGYNGVPHDLISVLKNGNVGIGTTNPTSRLTVAGDIRAREIKVEANAGADFVFAPDYRLRSLSEVEQFITANQRLPDIAPADSMVQNGVNMGEMQIRLLQKIEELTLYVIELKKENKVQSNRIDAQQSEIKLLKESINQ